MFHVVLYFMFSYLIILAVIFTVKRHRVASDKGKVFSIFAMILLLLPLMPHALVEYRTYKYKHSISSGVSDAAIQIGISPGRIHSIKVFSISSREAEVLVVSGIGKDKFVADMLSLEKSGTHWKFNDQYYTVWSQAGSADSNTFPPYASKGDYR